MLNEKLKYSQYQFDYYRKEENKEKKYRICIDNFNNNFTGVPRALEIIARYELFENRSTPAKTKKRLLEWLDELKKEDNLKMVLSHAKAADKIKQLVTAKQEALDEFIKHYSKRSIDLKNTGRRTIANVNDINVSTWDKTIASALEKGPLKEYILVEKEDLSGKVYKCNRDTERLLSEDRAKNHKDYLLKFTAYYLIENILKQKSVTLKELLIYNWSAYTRGTEYYFKADSSEKTYIFEKASVADSLNKFTFNPSWINNFELVDISKKSSLNKWLSNPKNHGKCYYTDNGAFELLEKHVMN